MQLTADYTLLIQILFFVVLWVCLKRLVFDPVLRVLEAREQRTVGTQADAVRLNEAAAGARDEHEQAVRTVRAQIAQESEAARQAAHDEHGQALGAARAAAADELGRRRAAVAAEAERARQALAAEAQAIAVEMLARVAAGRRA